MGKGEKGNRGKEEKGKRGKGKGEWVKGKWAKPAAGDRRQETGDGRRETVPEHSLTVGLLPRREQTAISKQ